MNLDEALTIVNDPSFNAYCDYTHETMYRKIGEYDFGYDETYDEIAYAYAYVAAEMAFDEDGFTFVPHDTNPPASGEDASA